MNFSGVSNKGLGRWLRAPLALLPKSFIIRVIQGPLKGLRWVKGSATNGCWLGSYELVKSYRFMNSIKPDSVVYDCGANVGYYSLMASRAVGPKGIVYAFEPVERNLHYLRRHIELNYIRNIEIVPSAVWHSTGTTAFSEAKNPSMGAIGKDGNTIVSSISLDDLVASGRALPPDVIKMDIEGAEYDAFVGAGKVVERYHPMFFLATHGSEIHQRCIEWLKGHGYLVANIDPAAPNDTDELIAYHAPNP